MKHDLSITAQVKQASIGNLAVRALQHAGATTPMLRTILKDFRPAALRTAADSKSLGAWATRTATSAENLNLRGGTGPQELLQELTRRIGHVRPAGADRPTELAVDAISRLNLTTGDMDKGVKAFRRATNSVAPGVDPFTQAWRSYARASRTPAKSS